jgi:energy-coupling factor transporter transmembrane protein EcfT
MAISVTQASKTSEGSVMESASVVVRIAESASVVVRIVALTMLCVAVFVRRLPLDYFTDLRFVVCIAGVLGYLCAFFSKRIGWRRGIACVLGLGMGLAALLFRPIDLVRLPRSVWQQIDQAVAVLIMVSLLFDLWQFLFPGQSAPLRDDLDITQPPVGSRGTA